MNIITIIWTIIIFLTIVVIGIERNERLTIEKFKDECVEDNRQMIEQRHQLIEILKGIRK